MRVLFVSNLYPPIVKGGYELLCQGIVDELRSRHEVLVLTAAQEPLPGDDPDVRRVLPWLQGRGANLSAGRAARTAVQTAAAVDSTFRPDVVSVWNASHVPHALILAMAQRGVPIAFHVCDYWYGDCFRRDQFVRYLLEGRNPADRLVRRLRGAQARRLGLRAGAVPAGVSWLSRALETLTPAPPLVEPLVERVIHGTTPHAASLASEPRRPSPTPEILVLGRICPEKGQDVAVEAVAALRDKHGVRARLVVAGSGDEDQRRRVANVAERLGLSGEVDVREALPPDRVGELLSEASVLLIPSRWEEPYGLVALEGALARVPVVAARSGGLAEILTEGEHALFFDRGDAGACADALAVALRDAGASRRRADAAFTYAQTFTQERYVAETEEFLRETVEAVAVRAG